MTIKATVMTKVRSAKVRSMVNLIVKGEAKEKDDSLTLRVGVALTRDERLRSDAADH